MVNVTTNKYGQTVALPLKDNTKLEKAVEKVLAEIGAEYLKQFDFAVMKDGCLAFLIECDGAPHYKEEYYVNCGNRECRAKAHLVKRHLGDAEKDAIALSHELPLLRINDMHENIIRDLVISWAWQFCDNANEKAK